MVQVLGFPAHAGIIPKTKQEDMKMKRLPRTRGDNPWYEGDAGATGAGFPAHAGIIPSPRIRRRRCWRLPRTRGDNPQIAFNQAANAEASPHTRG